MINNSDRHAYGMTPTVLLQDHTVRSSAYRGGQGFSSGEAIIPSASKNIITCFKLEKTL